MSESILHKDHVRTSIKKMYCDRVSQRMKPLFPPGNSGHLSIFLHQVSVRSPLHRRPIGVKWETGLTANKLEAAKRLLSERMPPGEVAQTLGVSVPTLYRWCPAADRMLGV